MGCIIGNGTKLVTDIHFCTCGGLWDLSWQFAARARHMSGSLGLQHKDPTRCCVLQSLHQKVAQLLHNFDDIQPTLLLFLQRLQCIAITDLTLSGKNAVMLRRQLPNDVVELRHGSDAQHVQQWLVVTQTVQPGLHAFCYMIVLHVLMHVNNFMTSCYKWPTCFCRATSLGV